MEIEKGTIDTMLSFSIPFSRGVTRIMQLVRAVLGDKPDMSDMPKELDMPSVRPQHSAPRTHAWNSRHAHWASSALGSDCSAPRRSSLPFLRAEQSGYSTPSVHAQDSGDGHWAGRVLSPVHMPTFPGMHTGYKVLRFLHSNHHAVSK